jgi:hypothetical protein
VEGNSPGITFDAGNVSTARTDYGEQAPCVADEGQRRGARHLAVGPSCSQLVCVMLERTHLSVSCEVLVMGRHST